MINLGHLRYSALNTLGSVDKTHETLVYQGQDDIVRLLKGDPVSARPAVQIIDPRGRDGTCRRRPSTRHASQTSA